MVKIILKELKYNNYYINNLTRYFDSYYELLVFYQFMEFNNNNNIIIIYKNKYKFIDKNINIRGPPNNFDNNLIKNT